MEQKYCTDCGRKLVPGKRFCPGCGTKVEMEQKTETCETGNLIEENKRNICPKCGNPISEDETECLYCRDIEIQIEKNKKRKKRILALVVVSAGIVLLVGWALAERNNENSWDSSRNDSYFNQGKQTTSRASDLKLSRIDVRHSGNYTYISGSITNASKTTKYRYIKVKAVCYGVGNKVVDTDWTYAVDSAWLEPGEKKNFEMMVKDPNRQIITATVTIMDD